ncbi:MAG: hypothetical protein HZC44_02195 [Geobacter sp.]|nr:hypothetical protein [Geobacter sp.]
MKRKSAETYFTSEEQERISLCVATAESGTSGEIAIMIVDESDRYREAGLAGALFLSAFVALSAALLTSHVTIWSYLPMMVLLLFPSLWLFRRFPRLKRPFAGRRRIAEAVRQRAVRAFYEKGLYRTRDETGILIFMSLLEQKVWILGDRGINELIDPAAWHGFAQELATGMAQGKGCDALCSVIGQCGAELSKHFPRCADDQNELTDQLLTEDRPLRQ